MGVNSCILTKGGIVRIKKKEGNRGRRRTKDNDSNGDAIVDYRAKTKYSRFSRSPSPLTSLPTQSLHSLCACARFPEVLRGHDFKKKKGGRDSSLMTFAKVKKDQA